jgi:hypothetical protein
MKRHKFIDRQRPLSSQTNSGNSSNERGQCFDRSELGLDH